MRKLKHYSESSIKFFDTVVSSKKNTRDDPDYKDRLNTLRNQIKEKFENYDSLFLKNELIKAISAGLVDPNKTDLINLYSYKSKPIQNLKIKVTTLENNRIINTCQNCTINGVNSFDHFLPQNEFSEFTVHPKNLIPSCTECNGHKSVIWQADNSLLFLNHYLDDLPEKQYLFVDISVDGNIINTEFYLDNRNGIDANLFKVISSHYNRLHLTKRFSDNKDDTVTELKNLIKAHRFHLSRKDIISTVNMKIALDKNSFGYNYWKAILQQELVNSSDFMDEIFI